MKQFLESIVYHNIVNTCLLLAVFAIIYLIIVIIINRKIDGIKKRHLFRARSFYTLIFIFLFFLTKIWVDGFTHLFTLLGLVGAGLVVTNKETIMNFVGWAVISWRNLFTEDDYIEFMSRLGYVTHIGPLYFSISESKKNGKIIKIPNGLILTNPIINYSQKETTFPISLEFKIKGDKSYIKTVESIKKIILNEVQTYIKNYQGKSKILKDLDQKITVTAKPDKDNPEHIRIFINYQSLYHEHEKLENIVSEKITFLLFGKN